jgi:DNA-binding NarL/FixJ family response regulator
MGRFARSGAKLDASLRAELSDREREVLRQTAWGHSNREIAARMETSVKTVEVHKINAMRKLDIKVETTSCATRSSKAGCRIPKAGAACGKKALIR